MLNSYLKYSVNYVHIFKLNKIIIIIIFIIIIIIMIIIIINNLQSTL